MSFIFVFGGVIGAALTGHPSWGLDFFLLGAIFGISGGFLLWRSSKL
jgi:hypothetical protein